MLGNNLYPRLGKHLIVAVVFYAVLGLTFALRMDPVRSALAQHWLAALLIAFALLSCFLLFLLIPRTRRWIDQKPALTRAALLVFVLVPAFVIAAGLLFVGQQQYAYYELRSLYLAVVILVPGIMFYLFIANRKTSLLNEFIANLDRLGLISTDTPDAAPISILSGQRRFESYVRKFEAIYGTVPPAMLQHALRCTSSDIDPTNVEPAPQGVFAWDMAIPVIVATLLIVLGWFYVLPLESGKSAQGSYAAALDLISDPKPVQFAFLGAYFFSLQMLFRRYVLRDLRPSAYVAVSIRIILAVIGTWVILALEPGQTKSMFLVTAFAIGVFPPILWQFVQASFKRVTRAQILLPSLGSQLPISDLDGLTVWHEARLEEEGIENIPNMATADVVELLVQTRFSADQIIDWIDQAILYTNLGSEEGNHSLSKRRRLRAHGIRTASSLELAFALATPGLDKEMFEKILCQDGDSNARSPMRALVATLGTNPNLQLIRKWKGLGSKAAQAKAV